MTIQRQIENERRQIEVEGRQAEVEKRSRVFETMTALEDADMSVDDRMRVHVRDYLASSGLGEVAASSSGQRREICLQSFVRDHKNDTTPPISLFQNISAKLGRLCVKQAKIKFGETFAPDKKTFAPLAVLLWLCLDPPLAVQLLFQNHQNGRSI